MTAKLPKLDRCPLCSGECYKDSCGAVACRNERCPYVAETEPLHRALAKLAKGKVVKRGYMCDMPAMCFCRTKPCRPHKTYNCRRVAIVEVPNE